MLTAETRASSLKSSSMNMSRLIPIAFFVAIIGVAGYGSDALIRAALCMVAFVGIVATVSALIRSSLYRACLGENESRLIASAPLMRDALSKALLAEAQGLESDTWAEDARLALQKARGEC